MLVIVTKYPSARLEELRKLAREMLNYSHIKSCMLEVVCSYQVDIESFQVSARLYLFGALIASSVVQDNSEQVSFSKAIESVLRS